MKRHNPYEAAVEAYLRQSQAAYMAVDEARRSLLPTGSIKNVDFLVTTRQGLNLVMDVKGRRFPSGKTHPTYWRNWTTREELTSLVRWQVLLGPRFVGCLVFAYQIVGDRTPVEPDDLFVHRGRIYAFLAITLPMYLRHAKPLSTRWETVTMPTAMFREQARPLGELLSENSQTVPPQRDSVGFEPQATPSFSVDQRCQA